MKKILRTLFSPILNFFESGSGDYTYKTSHRTILFAMGFLFTSLASLVAYLAVGQDIGYLLPVVVFGSAGLLSIMISLLGSDRAVAKIWGSTNQKIHK